MIIFAAAVPDVLRLRRLPRRSAVSKRAIVVACKVAEIGIMAARLRRRSASTNRTVGFGRCIVVLFLMGAHSAFFGPAKYGILPEMIRPSDLPRANGVFLMLTFLAIIFGTAVAGILAASSSAAGCGSARSCCMAIAVVGTITALFGAPRAAGQAELEVRAGGDRGAARHSRACCAATASCCAAIVVVAHVLDGRRHRAASRQRARQDAARTRRRADQRADRVDRRRHRGRLRAGRLLVARPRFESQESCSRSAAVPAR